MMNRLMLLCAVAGLSLIPGAASAQSPYQSPSGCAASPGSVAGSKVCSKQSDQYACDHFQFCWWRDTTAQNALAAHTLNHFTGQVVTVYSSSKFNIHVYLAQDAANVILMELPTTYALFGLGGSDTAAAQAKAALFAAVPDLAQKSLSHVILLSGHKEEIGGAGPWGLTSSIPIYVNANWITYMQLQKHVEGAGSARAARAGGSGLSWGTDGFLGTGSASNPFDPTAPVTLARPNTAASADTTTSVTLEGGSPSS